MMATTKTCVICKQLKPVEAFKPTRHVCKECVNKQARENKTDRDKLRKKDNLARWYKNNKEKADNYAKNWRQQERLALIASFGGKCSVCGESDPIVLDFDHINDDGHKDSKKNIIYRVKENPSRFQLLCKNCNWRKEYWRRQNAK